MKLVKDKQVLVGSDISGYSLKEAVVKHLRENGWEVTDIGVKEADLDNPEMFHRVGLKVGARISEGEFERAIIFCGSGMGIHIAASKCPHTHVALCESVPTALRSRTANNANILAMGGFIIAPQMGIEMAEAFLNNNLGDGYNQGFYDYHKLAFDELEAFDYEEFKKNGFEVKKLG